MLAIVAAFKEEMGDFLKRGDFRSVSRRGRLRFYLSPARTEIVVVVGAFGRHGAEEATREVIGRYKPDYLVSAGFAGGVKEGVQLGDLFVCDGLVAVEGSAAFWKPGAALERRSLDVSLVEKLTHGKHAGTDYARCECLSVSEFISSSEMKAWIGSSFGVGIVDMESYWVCETAAEVGVPHVVVRSVLDTVEQTLPPLVGDAVRSEDTRRWDRVVRYIAGRPWEVSQLYRMARQTKVAAASLSAFLANLHGTPVAPPVASPNRG